MPNATIPELGVVNKIVLQVIDVHGNTTSRHFDIDITPLLPSSKVVSIPDENLAAAVREELGLASGAPITNLDMLRLSELRAVGRQITNLTGLEHAIYLRYLKLLDNQINDLTVISQLPSLRELDIGGNKIRDITPLKVLTDLRALLLWNNSISDIAVLTSLPSLDALSIGDNPIRDIRPVWELTQVRYLSLSSLEIRDLSPLTKFTNLSQLTLGHNQVSDITPLAGLTGLTELNLNNNQISDVTPLTALINLRMLNLVQNPIKVKDRKPLFALLEKNPDVKIFLKHGGEPLPVTLFHFRAELTDAGTVLKWITESELDNAGFYIYRSETKEGEFKVVNPTLIQGAGTTNERNEYAWTDTTAKPNTVYYYRIEDVSHAGVRKQLVTGRMRGFVSATGKLTTKWADLKAQD